jgi:hypothetical protein
VLLHESSLHLVGIGQYGIAILPSQPQFPDQIGNAGLCLPCFPGPAAARTRTKLLLEMAARRRCVYNPECSIDMFLILTREKKDLQLGPGSRERQELSIPGRSQLQKLILIRTVCHAS